MIRAAVTFAVGFITGLFVCDWANGYSGPVATYTPHPVGHDSGSVL